MTTRAARGGHPKGTDGLTDLQFDTLKFIVDHARAKLYQPSVREIADHFGLTSVNSIVQMFKSLERKGWIKVTGRRSRAIDILRLPDMRRGRAKRPRSDEPKRPGDGKMAARIGEFYSSQAAARKGQGEP